MFERAKNCEYHDMLFRCSNYKHFAIRTPNRPSKLLDRCEVYGTRSTKLSIRLTSFAFMKSSFGCGTLARGIAVTQARLLI